MTTIAYKEAGRKRAQAAAKTYKSVCTQKRIRLLEPYVDALTKVKHRCLECSTEWDIRPNDVRSRKGHLNGCPTCSKGFQSAGRSLPFQQRKQIIEAHGLVKVVGKEVIRQEGTYRRLVDVKCLTCKQSFRGSVGDLSEGHGCRPCRYKGRQLYTNKQVKIGRRTVVVQGNEPQAIAYLLTKGVKPSDISTCGEPSTPVIKMSDGCRYFPDLYIKSKNIVIEVKSVWTLGLHPSMSPDLFNRTKFKASETLKQGFEYRLFVMTTNGRRIPLPLDWCTYTRPALRKIVKEFMPTKKD